MQKYPPGQLCARIKSNASASTSFIFSLFLLFCRSYAATDDRSHSQSTNSERNNRVMCIIVYLSFYVFKRVNLQFVKKDHSSNRVVCFYCSSEKIVSWIHGMNFETRTYNPRNSSYLTHHFMIPREAPKAPKEQQWVKLNVPGFLLSHIPEETIPISLKLEPSLNKTGPPESPWKDTF